jgi:hypothetical protein
MCPLCNQVSYAKIVQYEEPSVVPQWTPAFSFCGKDALLAFFRGQHAAGQSFWFPAVPAVGHPFFLSHVSAASAAADRPLQ